MTMPHQYYVLDKNNNIKPVSAARWAFTFEHHRRVVARETVGGVIISTVFLGLDHSFNMGGPPMVFETMVFDADDSLICQRYSSWNEAVEGHRDVVMSCKAIQTVADLTIDSIINERNKSK
jgi:hypothetical protein